MPRSRRAVAGAGHRRARLGLPGFRRRRAGHEDDACRAAARAPGRIVLGGGVAANRALRTRLAGEAEALGVPLIVPRPGALYGQRRDDRRRRGAGGSRPVSGRARSSTRDRRCRSLAPATARDCRVSRVPDVPSPTRPRLDALAVRRTLREAGLRPRHRLSQNFLVDVDVLEGDPRGGRAGARRARARDRARAGRPDRRAPRGGRAVTAVELDRGLAAQLRTRSPSGARATGALRLVEGDALDQDLVRPRRSRRTTSSRTCRTTSPARSLHRLLGGTPRAATGWC